MRCSLTNNTNCPTDCDECSYNSFCTVYQKVLSIKRCLNFERVCRYTIKEEFQRLRWELEYTEKAINKAVGEDIDEAVGDHPEDH